MLLRSSESQQTYKKRSGQLLKHQTSVLPVKVKSVENSFRMQIILAILIVIISLNGIKPFTVSDDPNWENSIIINGFNYPADAASIEKISKHKQVFWFFNAIVDILPYNFTELFENCNEIKFYGGSVKSIHITPKLDCIVLYNTSTENVIIKPDMFYKLGDFSCTKSKLTHIPENINRLKHLKNLDLGDNLIEIVQMDQLNGLDNLEELSLSSNKIKHIYSDGPVSLPSLNTMYLIYNRLQHFDVCNWNMPTLSSLYLQGNNLTHFAIHQFPALELLLIYGNPLNCAWKDSLKNTSIRHQFYISCDEKSVGAFELDCSPQTYHQLKQQVSSVDTKLRQIEVKMLNNYQQVSDRMQKIESLLQNLTAKIIEQQNVSNDIIEAMYRIEIERASNQTKKIP
ncbi:leucine-rich repeat-containing protein let-4-like [Aedes albopictus]|uniref:Dynein axonemal assembly factor 1 homolog n=1 Tax=Aedes albopictus TaxID=7160 RepID=A0ABM1Z5D6_AEDAL